MKRIKPIFTAVAVVSLTASLVIGVGFAQSGQSDDGGDQVIKVNYYEGKEYRSLAGKPSPNSENAVTPTIDSVKAREENLRVEDRMNIKKWLLSNHNAGFGGLYTDDNGNYVFQLTDQSPELAQQIKKLSKFGDSIKISYVKYSEKQLKDAESKIMSLPLFGEMEMISVNPISNKVEIYISQESLNKNKEEILQYIDEDMVIWNIQEVKIENLAANLFPGERVERYIDGASWGTCSIGFNATAGTNRVGVTAGHCLDGTWYDLSDNSSSIGTMSNAVDSDTSKYDGGYINYNSNANRSYVLNGNSLTIGDYDYSGLYREVGDSIYVHATSGVGNSFGPLIVRATVNLSGGPDDMLIADDSAVINGDSGGLIYSIANNGTKNFARVEGILTGRAYVGTTPYTLFSKFSHVYNGLGLTGVYVDPAY